MNRYGFEEEVGLPGGWHFLSGEGGYRIPLKGELHSAQAVIDALMNYRLENNLPVGDPAADMERYVCTNFPNYCRPKNAGLPPELPKGQRNVDLVVGWANVLYVDLGRLTLVPGREAEERSKTCQGCPQQMDWANDCPPCVTSAQRLLMILRQGKDVSNGASGKLKGCAAHGWDNRTAVWLDNEHLPKEANPTAPPECWVRHK